MCVGGGGGLQILSTSLTFVYGFADPIVSQQFRLLDIYLLLAECEVRTASYGPSFFLPFMAQARSARAMKTRKEKTRIHNLPYAGCPKLNEALMKFRYRHIVLT